ncbi:MAG: hypothetical protein ABSE81_07080 [Candidatus Omnitrophota bacterium]|jgi:hypothetical protein
MLNHKGQAVTEMAIFGTLIIAAFAFVIMFSERINRQQSYIMQGFRESLYEARTLQNPVSYTKIADRRMPNVSSPMTLGSQETFNTTNNTMWGNDFAKLDQPQIYYKINDANLIQVAESLSTSISGGGGSGAVITPVITNGVITGFTINSGGSGYTSAPTITIYGGSGTSATATAVITDGVVTGVTITSGGSGYVPAPSGNVSEVTTTQQTTHTENEQTLTKSASVDSVSVRQLKAQDTLIETSPDYNQTFYLGPGGKYYVNDSGGESRSGSLTAAGGR